MEKYTFDLLPDDIGEIVTMIRVQHLRLHAEPFAKKLGVQEKMLLSVEDGKGPHGMLLLKKINEVFPNVSVTVNVELL